MMFAICPVGEIRLSELLPMLEVQRFPSGPFTAPVGLLAPRTGNVVETPAGVSLVTIGAPYEPGTIHRLPSDPVAIMLQYGLSPTGASMAVTSPAVVTFATLSLLQMNQRFPSAPAVMLGDAAHISVLNCVITPSCLMRQTRLDRP